MRPEAVLLSSQLRSRHGRDKAVSAISRKPRPGLICGRQDRGENKQLNMNHTSRRGALVG